jgi:type II secretory pathway component GspD/PulD (secretin)
MKDSPRSHRAHGEKNTLLFFSVISVAPWFKPALVLLLIASFAFTDDAILTKAFRIKFRSVDEAASLVNGLLSEEGTVTMQPHMKTIVVRDTDKNLRQIESSLSAFDTPPPSVELSIKLVLAKKTENASAVSQEIKDIGKLGEVLRFNDYTLLDNGLITSEEGRSAILNLAKDYQVSFATDVIQEGNGIIRLKNFQLKKRKRGRSKEESLIPLLSVTVNLRNSETLVLGASQFEESNQALLIILLGKVKK